MKPLAIVPTYVTTPYDVDVTQVCVESMRRTVGDAIDLFVVDDGSPDKELVAALRGLVEDHGGEFFAKEDNSGFSRTVNVGLRKALQEGRDAVLVNADIEFTTTTWLDLMLKQMSEDGSRPASIVGALLLYPNGLIQSAGTFFCSPGDEPILTVGDGYVPIGELSQSDHGLVSYARRNNRIHRCATQAGRRMPGSGRQAGGYEFTRGVRPYAGALLGIETKRGIARMTPNHGLTVFWNNGALESWAVYVMRRGRDWRIGHTKMSHGGRHGRRGWAFGPRLRLDQQRADAIWIVDLCQSREDALALENLLAWQYGVPTLQFYTPGHTGLPLARLDDIWAELDVEDAASVLLLDYGRDPAFPLIEARRERGRRLPIGKMRRYPISAANLLPGYMEVPGDPGSGQRIERLSFELQCEAFIGDVYSLEVRPHEHYVSNGVVLHNSLLYREFDHIFRYAPQDLPEARIAKECPVTGALQFIRHECLAGIGVYDERFRMGFEDVDFCIRAHNSGRSIVYQPGVQAIHHESLFRGRKSKKLDDWHALSWQYFTQKWSQQSMAEFVPFFAS